MAWEQSLLENKWALRRMMLPATLRHLNPDTLAFRTFCMKLCRSVGKMVMCRHYLAGICYVQTLLGREKNLIFAWNKRHKCVYKVSRRATGSEHNHAGFCC